jgi:endogenous inhibitor of DNA gyrase (YacG/DUF329 family)
MAQIMIDCPTTGKAVSTGMAADKACWAKLPDAWMGTAFRCPACDTMHTWNRSDAYLEALKV